MAAINRIPVDNLRSICELIGDTGEGLTGSEIGRVLSDCNINDPLAGGTKKHRLFEALNERQNQDGCSNHIFSFLKYVMSPVRYRDKPQLFKERLNHLNEILAFIGLAFNEKLELTKSDPATTISEAKQRANSLRKKLVDRNVHPDVFRFCREELLQENYFHAVFEAAKSVADKIKVKSGIEADGAELVDKVFGLGSNNAPLLALNSLRTESEQSEHKGLANLLKGMFGVFRNVTAHAPKIHWYISEEDALDSLTLISFLHRKLDKCVSTKFS
jgi:uncharacterized protein (TIGR02391 family)